MKLSVFLLLVTFVQVSASTYAQKFNLSFNHVPLEKAFQTVRMQSGFNILYNLEMIAKTPKVDMVIKNASIEDVMDKLLDGRGLGYHIIDSNIIISPKKAEKAGAALLSEAAVTGKVTDDSNNPLAGVTVRVKNTQILAVTDPGGVYKIKVPDNQAILLFSFIGFEPKEVPVGSNTEINVALKSVSGRLDEVVVIGYGTSTKRDISSAISSISEKELKNVPMAGIDQMLQGKAAGVSVSTNTGQPGGGVSVRIRGITSATTGNEPLYVINGVPMTSSTNSIGQGALGGIDGQTSQSVLATLNPSDIESVDILKDASAQAIYGSMAANGVVLITTKKGKNGDGKITYNAYYGVQKLQKKLPVMDLKQYAGYYNSLIAEGEIGLDPIAEFSNPEVLGKGTDWEDEIFRTGQMQNHHLAFSGASNKTNYYFSGNYFKQEGIVLGSGFNRYTLTGSIDHQVKSWIKAGLGVNLSHSRQQVALTDGQESIISLMMFNSPATPVRDFDGNYLTTSNISGVPFGNTLNPVALSLLRAVEVNQKKAFGNFYLELQVLKGLTFRSQLNYDFQLNQNSAFQPKVINPYGILIIGPSRIREDRNTNFYTGLQNFATYDTRLGRHHLNAVLGHEAMVGSWDQEFVTANNLTKNMPSVNAGQIDNSQSGAIKGSWAAEGYFARLNYSYAGKYTFSGSLRRDGSSNFGEGRRWGFFPGASAAWILSNEEFAKPWAWVSNFKLRLGIGSVGGSQTRGDAAYITNIRLIPNMGGLFGQTTVPGIPANVGNPFLGWLSVVTYNSGIDLSIFKNRINLAVDAYKKVTTNMIMSTVMPSFSGLDPNPPNLAWREIEPPVTNAGRMTNTGVDISLNTSNIEGQKFSWKSTVIFSHYKNILNELYTPGATLIGKSQDFAPQTLTITKPGRPVGTFYGYVTDGLYRTEAELKNGPKMQLPIEPHGTWLGDIRYKDLDGNGVINSDDQTVIGNPNPQFTYGLTNTFTFKNIDLSIFLTGVCGGEIFNYSRLQTEAMYNVYHNQLTSVIGRYTAANTSATMPRFNLWNNNNLYISDRFIEDASYLRIQNITIGYNFPSKILQRIKASNIRLYISVQNLHTFSKYKGYDPELGSYNGNVLTTNIDYGHYPNPRTATLGLNVDF